MPCLANPSKTIKPKITSPLGSYCKYLYNAEKQGVLRDTQGKKKGNYVVTPFPNRPPKVKIINNKISTMSTVTDREEITKTHSW